jgi:hypothetical protein
LCTGSWSNEVGIYTISLNMTDNNDIWSFDELGTLLRDVDAMVEFESNDHHRGSGSLVRRVCVLPYHAWSFTRHYFFSHLQ